MNIFRRFLLAIDKILPDEIFTPTFADMDKETTLWGKIKTWLP